MAGHQQFVGTVLHFASCLDMPGGEVGHLIMWLWESALTWSLRLSRCGQGLQGRTWSRDVFQVTQGPMASNRLRLTILEGGGIPRCIAKITIVIVIIINMYLYLFYYYNYLGGS